MLSEHTDLSELYHLEKKYRLLGGDMKLKLEVGMASLNIYSVYSEKPRIISIQ